MWWPGWISLALLIVAVVWTFVRVVRRTTAEDSVVSEAESAAATATAAEFRELLSFSDRIRVRFAVFWGRPVPDTALAPAAVSRAHAMALLFERQLARPTWGEQIAPAGLTVVFLMNISHVEQDGLVWLAVALALLTPLSMLYTLACPMALKRRVLRARQVNLELLAKH